MAGPGGPSHGGGGGRRGGGDRRGDREQQSPYIEKLIAINRVAKVHKGGKRMSFTALVVIGDGQGKVGLALGKSGEAPDAIRKGFMRAQRNLVSISLKRGTIPHETLGRADASKVILKPASPGTGIIAGGPVRAVCEVAGVKDILTKSLGSSNSINLAYATFNGLCSLNSAETILGRRRTVVEEPVQA